MCIQCIIGPYLPEQTFINTVFLPQTIIDLNQLLNLSSLNSFKDHIDDIFNELIDYQVISEHSLIYIIFYLTNVIHEEIALRCALDIFEVAH